MTINQSAREEKLQLLLAEFIWLSDTEFLTKVPIRTFPRDSWLLVEFEFSSFTGGSSRIYFYLSGFGRKSCWILWKSEWDDQTNRHSSKTPIAGILKSDIEDSKSATLKLLTTYLKSLDYEFEPDYIGAVAVLTIKEIRKILQAL